MKVRKTNNLFLLSGELIAIDKQDKENMMVVQFEPGSIS